MKIAFAFLFASFSILYCSSISAKKMSDNLLQANYFYRHFDFAEAIPYYLKSRTDEKDALYFTRLGECYEMIHAYDSAEKNYGLAYAQPECDPVVKLRWANTLIALEKYSKAATLLKEYKNIKRADRRIANMIAGCEAAMKPNTRLPTGKTRLLEFNTDKTEFGPTLWNDSTLVFCDDTAVAVKKKEDEWTGSSFFNMYSVHCDKSGECSGPFNLITSSNDVNIKYHDGPCTFSKTGNSILFTRSRYKNGFFRKKALSNQDSVVVLESMIGTDYDTSRHQFKTFSKFPFNNKEYSVAYPTVHPNGKIIVYSTNKPGGFGGFDLYLTTRSDDGIWQEPRLLPVDINTEGDEICPYFADETTLYFSSNGLPGFGGFDIYKAKFDVQKCQFYKPENMQQPINSSRDDISMALSADGGWGYLSSNRPAKAGSDNIYFYKRQQLYVRVEVTDSVTGQPIKGAKAQFSSPDIKFMESTDDDGKIIKQVLPQGAFSYTLKVNDTDGYLPKTLNSKYLPGKDIDTIYQRITLIKLSPIKNLPCGKVFLRLSVKDSSTGLPLTNVNIKLQANHDNRIIDYVLKEVDANGIFETTVKPQETYQIDVEKVEYNTKYPVLNVPPCIKGKDTTIIMEVNMGKVSNPDSFVFRTVIPFDFNKFNLNDSAQKKLQIVVNYLKKARPDYHLKLRAHADCRGKALSNLELSKKRAKAVKDYLISDSVNISVTRIDACVGVGASEPIYNCCNCNIRPNDTGRKRAEHLRLDNVDCSRAPGTKKECEETEHYQNRYLECIMYRKKE